MASEPQSDNLEDTHNVKDEDELEPKTSNTL